MIVDDDAMVRQLLGIIFSKTDDIEVVGEAGDARHGVEQAIAHRPDVVLMDIAMPGMNGIEAVQELHRAMGDGAPEVVMITTLDPNDEPQQAFEAGARGFLLKTDSPDQIVASVRAVHSGEGFLTPRVARQFIDEIREVGQSGEEANARARVEALSERELAVGKLLAHGLTNAQISEELFVSASTVKSHIASIQTKLEVEGRVPIAVQFVLAGLVSE